MHFIHSTLPISLHMHFVSPTLELLPPACSIIPLFFHLMHNIYAPHPLHLTPHIVALCILSIHSPQLTVSFCPLSSPTLPPHCHFIPLHHLPHLTFSPYPWYSLKFLFRQTPSPALHPARPLPSSLPTHPSSSSLRDCVLHSQEWHNRCQRADHQPGVVSDCSAGRCHLVRSPRACRQLPASCQD